LEAVSRSCIWARHRLLFFIFKNYRPYLTAKKNLAAGVLDEEREVRRLTEHISSEPVASFVHQNRLANPFFLLFLEPATM